MKASQPIQQPCISCETLQDPDETSPAGECGSCSSQAPCSSCSQWSEVAVETPNGECEECTSHVQCFDCNLWEDASDIAPDGKCVSCSDYYRCEACADFVEGTDDLGNCSSCSTREYCGECSDYYDTEEHGSCPDCWDDDESEEEGPVSDTYHNSSSKVDSVPAPDLRFAHRFGIEFEGGWNSAPEEECKGDSSVTVRGEYHSGEVVSDILESWSEIQSFIRRNYPHRINSSCGMHVHISFCDHTEYVWRALHSLPKLDAYFIRRLKRFGERLPLRSQPFRDRLNGENQFCQPDAPKNDRYRAINWCSYSSHGTIEIRVLPMFKSARIATLAIREVLRIIDRAARVAARSTPKFNSVPLPEPIAPERTVPFVPEPDPVQSLLPLATRQSNGTVCVCSACSGEESQDTVNRQIGLNLEYSRARDNWAAYLDAVNSNTERIAYANRIARALVQVGTGRYEATAAAASAVGVGVYQLDEGMLAREEALFQEREQPSLD